MFCQYLSSIYSLKWRKETWFRHNIFVFKMIQLTKLYKNIYSWTFTSRMKNNCKIKQCVTVIDIYTCMLCKVQEAREITFHYSWKENSIIFQGIWGKKREILGQWNTISKRTAFRKQIDLHSMPWLVLGGMHLCKQQDIKLLD